MTGVNNDLKSLFTLLKLYNRHNNNNNNNDYGYQVHGTERKISHSLHMDDLKLLGRNWSDLNNEIKIVQTAKI